jgi:putative transcriptional regulator
MGDEEVEAAALADPDAQPLTPERMARMRRVPRAKTIRRALGLSIEPDAPALAYLSVIAREPDIVRQALESVGESR